MNQTSRIIIPLAAAFALALPGAAFAREGESGGSHKIAEAPARGALDDGAATEHATETEATEPKEAAEATEPEAGDDRAAADDNAGADDAPVLPELHPAFLRRSWKFTASADGFDAETGVLS